MSTTHEKLAHMVSMLHAKPQTVEDMAAALEYHPDGVRRFLRALQAKGYVTPQGVRENHSRGSKPLAWGWVR